jgi:hypothetical protein
MRRPPSLDEGMHRPSVGACGMIRSLSPGVAVMWAASAAKLGPPAVHVGTGSARFLTGRMRRTLECARTERWQIPGPSDRVRQARRVTALCSPAACPDADTASFEPRRLVLLPVQLGVGVAMGRAESSPCKPLFSGAAIASQLGRTGCGAADAGSGPPARRPPLDGHVLNPFPLSLPFPGPSPFPTFSQAASVRSRAVGGCQRRVTRPHTPRRAVPGPGAR